MITKKQALLSFIIGVVAVLAWIIYARFSNNQMPQPQSQLISPEIKTGDNAANKMCEIPSQKNIKINQAIKGEVAAFTLLSAPKPVTNLMFQNEKGDALSLNDFKGKALLVNLWATWCAPCREEMPALDHVQQIKGGADFQVLTINIDTRNLERPQTWLKEAGIKNLAYYSDPQAKTFQILRSQGVALGMPVTLIVDQRGCHIGHLNGPAQWASEDAIKLLEAVQH